MRDIDMMRISLGSAKSDTPLADKFSFKSDYIREDYSPVDCVDSEIFRSLERHANAMAEALDNYHSNFRHDADKILDAWRAFVKENT